MYIFLVFHRNRIEKVCICKPLIEVGGSQSHIQDSVDKNNRECSRHGNELKNGEITGRSHGRGGKGRKAQISQPSILDLPQQGFHIHFQL